MAWDGKEERRKTPMHCQDEIHARLESIEELVKKINLFITGNGYPERGLIVKVDRLNQAKTLILWVSGVSLASAIGLIINGIAEAMKR